MQRPQQLHVFLEGYAPEGFSWGQANCIHYTFDWIKLAEGVDLHAKAGIGPTPTMLAAYREIRKRGRDLSSAFESVYEKARQPVTTLLTGDIVCLPLGRSAQALGISIGRHAAFLAETGFVYFTLDHATHGWRVG